MMRRLRAFLPLLISMLVLSATGVAWSSPRTITMDDRIAAQRAIEEIYWRHRIWPKENPGPKPALDKVMPQALLRGRVESYLKMSNSAASIWHRPITGEQLQAELDRIGRSSRDPKLLREIFDALGNDAELIAETLVRQTLVERLIRNWYAGEHWDGKFDAWWSGRANTTSVEIAGGGYGYKLPTLPASTCTNDTWRATYTDLPEPRAGHYAVWTGSEMLIWGGGDSSPNQGGGRYNPATDTWAPMARDANAPPAADQGTAVWTGTEMIIWGGLYYPPDEPARLLNSGARYDPMTDAWTPTSTGPGVPSPRYYHTAVWTGTEMIIWSGRGDVYESTGGRYSPATDSWIPTSTGPGVPAARYTHTAVWTGSEMIIWGGAAPGLGTMNTGGRYDPSSDSWSALSTIGAPLGRQYHTATWTGNRMVVFGGRYSSDGLNTGGLYDPATDTWAPTNSTPGVAPEPRYQHVSVWTGSKLLVFGGNITPSSGRLAYAYDPSGDAWTPVSAPPISSRTLCSAVWTGTEMIIWGGGFFSTTYNDGARYDPSSDTWVLTSTATTVPEGRHYSAAVWTGTEMIVWGGVNSRSALTAIDSGGRYMPATDSWIPTSRGADVPAARYFHTAVWTGREMIVWGGWSSTTNGSLNSGGRYDPITDTWLPTSTGANVPSARSQHKAVWTGNKMVVFGSGTGGGRYDPLTDTWLPVSLGPGAPTPTQLGMVWTGTEMLAWPGGYSAGGRYDPVNDTWAAFPSGNGVVASRIEYSTVWSGSEMIVWGGGGPTTNTGGRFNPLTSLWTPTSTGANVPTERLEQAAVWTGSEMIIFGGVRPGNPAPFNGGGRYDPASDSWSPLATAGAPANIPVQSAVWTGTQLIVWSGFSNTNTGGLYCACPNGALFYRDADGDGFGDPGLSAPSCDGSAPAGYVDDHTDCNDAAASTHPDAAEVCNGIDDNCDGLVDEGASGIDADGDLVAGACDNCPLVANATQSDFDHDREGDACDLNDGEIWQRRDDKTSVSWQAEQGTTSWNLYTGDLDVLRSTGIYTQAPGSNALADRQCQLASTIATDTNDPAPGKASYTLVTGVTGGVEGSLGASSSAPRPNANPCP